MPNNKPKITMKIKTLKTFVVEKKSELENAIYLAYTYSHKRDDWYDHGNPDIQPDKITVDGVDTQVVMRGKIVKKFRASKNYPKIKNGKCKRLGLVWGIDNSYSIEIDLGKHTGVVSIPLSALSEI